MPQARQVAERAFGSFENNAKPRRKRKRFGRGKCRPSSQRTEQQFLVMSAFDGKADIS